MKTPDITSAQPSTLNRPYRVQPDIYKPRESMKRTCRALAWGAACAAVMSSPLTAQDTPEAQQTGADASEKRIGIGLMVGEPTGASVKYWLSEESAIDGVVGLSLDQGDDFSIHADYLYHVHDVFQVDSGRFSFYFGGGPRFVARDRQDDLFGLRTVAGLAYEFEDAPVDVFIEGGPVFDFTPDVDVRYTLGAGARFWF